MKAASKMFSIFEALCEEGEAGVSELASKLDMPKSSVFRFLSVLVENNYVQADKKYSPTLKILHLAMLVRSRIDLVEVARPVMDNIGKKMNETISLSVFENNQVVYIHKVESSESIRSDYLIGSRVDAYCTAMGKVFLAGMTESEIENYLDNTILESRTPTTIVSRSALKKELEAIRIQGYAIDDGEYHLHNRCVAVPIKNETGQIMAAMSISGPDFRMSKDCMEEFKKEIMAAGKMISGNIGYGL